MESKPVTYEEFMAEDNWKDNVQYLQIMIQNGDIELSTAIRILKEVNNG